MVNKAKSPPIFVGGVYRSGTSLLRAMLSRHSNIAGGLETFWFDLDFAGKAQGNNIRNWDGTRCEPLHEHVYRLTDFYDLDKEFVLSLTEKCSTGEEFIDRFMAEYTKRKEKLRWVEKTPANILHMKRIFTFWPKGRFIHVIRDPRDVYSSVRRTGKWSEPEIFAKLWIKFINAYVDAKQKLPQEFIMEVRYENLVHEPEQTIRTVLDFIREPWEEEVANFKGESTDFEKVKSLTGKSSTTLEMLSKPLVKNRVGAWRDELQEKVLKDLEMIIEDQGFAETWNHYKFYG